MGRFGLLVLVFMLIGAVSCEMIKRREAKLPADWPIPQLTLPQEIEVKAGPEAMHDLDPSLPDKEWVVAWNKDDNWPAAVAHVEACLKPLNYWRSTSIGANNPLGLDLPEMRTYYSPDFLTEVLFSHGAYFDLLGPQDIEFALKVTVYKEPPPMMASLLHIKKTRPEMYEQLRDNAIEKIE